MSEVFSVPISGFSSTNEINYDFSDKPIIMNFKPYQLELLNFSFIYCMPNVEGNINGIIIPKGRYNYTELFGHIDQLTNGKVKITLNENTAIATMITTESITGSSLLSQLGFPAATYTAGTHISEYTPNIESSVMCYLMCDQISNDNIDSYNGKTRYIKCLYSFKLIGASNTTISLAKTLSFSSTLAADYKLDNLRFYLMDEHMKPFDFGIQSSEFSIRCQIKKII